MLELPVTYLYSNWISFWTLNLIEHLNLPEWNVVCRWHVMNYYVQLRSRFITSFIWFSFLSAAQFHSKVRSFQDCVCPLLLSILFVHFIFSCQINSLYVHLVSTCRNQKSIDINLLIRLTVHCMLEPLFV